MFYLKNKQDFASVWLLFGPVSCFHIHHPVCDPGFRLIAVCISRKSTFHMDRTIQKKRNQNINRQKLIKTKKYLFKRKERRISTCQIDHIFFCLFIIRLVKRTSTTSTCKNININFSTKNRQFDKMSDDKLNFRRRRRCWC